MASKRIHQSSVINIDVCCSMTVIVSQLFVWLFVYVRVTCAQKIQQIHLSFPMLRHLSVTFLTLFSTFFVPATHTTTATQTHTMWDDEKSLLSRRRRHIDVKNVHNLSLLTLLMCRLPSSEIAPVVVRRVPVHAISSVMCCISAKQRDWLMMDVLCSVYRWMNFDVMEEQNV